MAEDHILLLPDQRTTQQWWKKSKYLCPLIFLIGVVCLVFSVLICFYQLAYHAPIGLKLMALNCWGTPYSFGSQDKENRMVNIGRKINESEYDVYLLEELWMRPDHATIKSHIPDGYHMTEISELGPYGTCDGRAAPTGCSGLAIVSRFPILETEFNVFSVHGDLWWDDGEYFARKGVGRVRIEPVPNITVDVFVTHTAASDYNSYYRQIQTNEVVEHVKNSDADFAILGGDFNIDPRMTNETTYHTLTNELSSAMHQFFKYLEELLKPKRATYGNPENTYSAQFGPALYDYIFYKSKGWNSVAINIFEVPFLKGLIFPDGVADTQPGAESDQDGQSKDQSKEKRSAKSVQSKGVLKSLSDHEAVTSHLVLFKYLW